MEKLMNEIEKIADQINYTYQDGFWGGGSIRELFRSFNEVEASSYPVLGAHSIWEITTHISVWHRIFEGRLINPENVYHYGNDWPNPDPITKENWFKVLDDLDKSNEKLAGAVRNFKNEDLILLVPGKEFTFYEMLHGISQHDQYHAGQVMILKKIIQNKNN
jgi:hypothetical protein